MNKLTLILSVFFLIMSLSLIITKADIKKLDYVELEQGIMYNIQPTPTFEPTIVSRPTTTRNITSCSAYCVTRNVEVCTRDLQNCTHIEAQFCNKVVNNKCELVFSNF